MVRYVGGKSRTAKKIIELITSECDPKEFKTFIEPFCGAVNVSIQANKYYDCHCSDYNEDMILLWKCCQDGLFEDVENITKEEYLEYKEKSSSWRRAVYGTCYSYRAMWYGSYFIYDGCVNASNKSVRKKIDGITGIKFTNSSVFNLSSDTLELIKKVNCVIYCDPPYFNTRQPYSNSSFNTLKFYELLKEWKSFNNHIYLSEKTCSIPNELIYSWTIVNSLNTKTTYDNLYYIL